MPLKIELGEDNPILRRKSEPIKIIDKKLKKFIKDMIATMKDAKGVGIAAPQVGVNERVCIVTLDGKKPMAMINPKITLVSKEKVWGEEGCLSLPDRWGEVERHQAITVTYTDEKEKQVTLKLKDFNARVVQHEIDHLDGILFIDLPQKPKVML